MVAKRKENLSKLLINCRARQTMVDHTPSNNADWSHVNHYVDVMSRQMRQNSGHLVQQGVVIMSDNTCKI